MSKATSRLLGVLTIAAGIVLVVVFVSRRELRLISLGSGHARPAPARAEEHLASGSEADERQAAGDVAQETGATRRGTQQAQPQRGATVVVRLLSTNSVGVTGRGTEVSLERAGRRPVRRSAGPSTYTFEDVGPGTWSLRARGPVHDEATREVFVPEGAGTVEVDLVLQARSAVRIAVVTPAGEPLAPRLGQRIEPRAIATRERPERYVTELLTDETRDECGLLHTRSYVGLEQRYVGLLELRCPPPLWVNLALGVEVLASQRLEPGVDELVFTLDPEELARSYPEVTLRVVDAASGEPLASTVAMHFGFWNSTYELGSSQGLEAGFYRIEGLPGPARLELQATGYETVRRDLLLPRTPEHDLGTIAMMPIGTGDLVLAVDLPEGAEGAKVSWAPLVAFTEGGAPRSWTGCPIEQGEKRITLGVGRWVLWGEARTEGRTYASARRVFDISTGEVRAPFALAPTCSVVLRAPAQRSVAVFQEDPALRVFGPTTCGPDDPRTLALVPGAYLAVAKDEAGNERSVSFAVTEAGATVDLP